MPEEGTHKMTERTETALRETLHELMRAGVSVDLEALDQIYHNDLQILMLTDDGALMSTDKAGCLALLKETFRGKTPEDHMWAKIHAVSVSGDRGHVLISRKIPIGGPEMLIDLSIDLIHQDGRWQVIREVNFSRPATAAA
ncbi:nuclear transport factor 2 family protein [Salipiger abyssi]|uniref:nuclear transport factor 2 family protein n=1 Tax=Salipiger abyssi TaxID=1250539 RepID=UPI001A8CE0BD|nr:nuclear transport factor 2 family protein [Salipiger abyssi]MBN9887332.1 nuclear transport factor 2 family protein [Salipiger abyssi]